MPIGQPPSDFELATFSIFGGRGGVAFNTIVGVPGWVHGGRTVERFGV